MEIFQPVTNVNQLVSGKFPDVSVSLYVFLENNGNKMVSLLALLTVRTPITDKTGLKRRTKGCYLLNCTTFEAAVSHNINKVSNSVKIVKMC